jgi:hypothetical protein
MGPFRAKNWGHIVDAELLMRELAEILNKPDLQDTASYIKGQILVDISDLIR